MSASPQPVPPGLAPPPPPASADDALLTLQAATRANLDDPRRQGHVITLPPRGMLCMTGDLHDHGPNLHRSLKAAALHQAPDRVLILHELIHGPTRVNGMDLSFRMLCQGAALRAAHPEQIIVLLSNHELAQARGEDIYKAGESVIDAFDDGLGFMFGDGYDELTEAMRAYVLSLPLAVRAGEDLLCSHSLPSPKMIENFDKSVLTRPMEDDDFAPKGPAHQMVWGRHQNAKIATELAEAWGVTGFLVGHQPADMGWDMQGGRVLILASNHDHGCVARVDLSRAYDPAELPDLVTPLAAWSVGP